MGYSRDDLKYYFREIDIKRGMEYYYQGRVKEYEEQQMGAQFSFHCQVEGQQTYQVTGGFLSRGLFGSCTCIRFQEANSCKHIVAGFLTHFGRKKITDTDKNTDFNNTGKQFIDLYAAKTHRQEEQTGEISLVPILNLVCSHQYPTLTFQVGREKRYVVKKIQEFLQHVERGDTVTYGKSLTFCHHIHQFTEPSQKLISILMDQYEQFGSYQKKYQPYHPTRDLSFVELNGGSFDRFFTLMLETTGEINRKSGTMTLGVGNPGVQMHLKQVRRGVQIQVELDGNWQFFGNSRSLYAFNDRQMLQCSREFLEQVYPLLEHKMPISFAVQECDMPAFCSCVVSAIQPHVQIHDPQKLLQQYQPDDCTIQFYFDSQNGTIYGTLVYLYGEVQVQSGTAPEDTPNIKRNLELEQRAKGQLEAPFVQQGNQFVLYDDDAPFQFLTELLPRFQRNGEVFLSESLLRQRVRPKKVGAGVSVSNGQLFLHLDTGEFPVEELEELYHSLLKKKKYHRLKDGRFLELNGSAYETLAETVHMTQLSPKDFRNGTASLPLFRGLYLDGLLSGVDGLQWKRDKTFREMVSRFHAVEEQGLCLSEDMVQTLRPYQQTGVQWLATLEQCGFGGILADEMGLGKTLQTIAFLTTKPYETTGKHNLVVCPTSLVLNWLDECQTFAPSLKVQLITGTAMERKKLLQSPSDADLFVTSYDLLKRDLEWYEPLSFYCCILDEGQYIKNQSTQSSKAVKQIQCERRFVLTGTPIENRLSELWNLFDFLMPGYLFSHNAFVKKLERPIVQSEDAQAGLQLSRLVQPFILRRLKKDVLTELPDKIEHVRRIRLSETERKVYQSAVYAAQQAVKQGRGKLEFLAALMQLRQICCNPALCFAQYQGEQSKLTACLELCQSMVENGHQILVFSQFTSMLSEIAKGLDGLNISHFTLQGSTPREERAALVKGFQNGKASVFLISLKAGGTGLNLTAADVVIHYDPWWNMAAQNQATDRVHRIGQQQHVQVYRLIAKDTIEEKILDLQEKKAALMDTIAQKDEGSILSMTQEELLSLLD